MKRLMMSSDNNYYSSLTVYHGSKDPNLTVSDIVMEGRDGDIGFHCGTIGQARYTVSTKHRGTGFIYEVVIQPSNILELTKDLDINWRTLACYQEYSKNANALLDQLVDTNSRVNSVVQALIGCGYDCVSYPNNVEDKEHLGDISYMVLDKSIISSMKIIESYVNDKLVDEDATVESSETDIMSSIDDDELILQSEIEIPFNQVITIHDDGTWDYYDDEYNFTMTDDGKHQHYDDEYHILLDDNVGIVEKLDDFLESTLPSSPGSYRIEGDLTLVYDIFNVFEDNNDDGYWSDEYGFNDPSYTVYTEDADVKYNNAKSSLKHFKYTKLK